MDIDVFCAIQMQRVRIALHQHREPAIPHRKPEPEPAPDAATTVLRHLGRSDVRQGLDGHMRRRYFGARKCYSAGRS